MWIGRRWNAKAATPETLMSVVQTAAFGVQGQAGQWHPLRHLQSQVNSESNDLCFLSFFFAAQRVGEGSDRGWDGWMASQTQRTWVWANPGKQRRKRKPGMLQLMGLQRVRCDLASEQQQTWDLSSLTTDWPRNLSALGAQSPKHQNQGNPFNNSLPSGLLTWMSLFQSLEGDFSKVLRHFRKIFKSQMFSLLLAKTVFALPRTLCPLYSWYWSVCSIETGTS